MIPDEIIGQVTNQALEIGSLTALLKMVYQTVDEKHIASSLRESIKIKLKL